MSNANVVTLIGLVLLALVLWEDWYMKPRAAQQRRELAEREAANSAKACAWLDAHKHVKP